MAGGGTRYAKEKVAGQVISQGQGKGKEYIVDVPAGKAWTSVNWRWLLENPEHTMAW
jgi:hypothetical protein